jgi:tetratricopeptide (TPR) repeat protein
MQISRTHWIGALISLVAVLAAAGIWYAAIRPRLPATSPDAPTAATSSVPTLGQATTTTPVVAAQVGPFPINAADTAFSWTFKGAYAGNDTLTAQANADITKLNALFGNTQYADYDLYNGIANDYGSLGEGKTAYQYYNRAIRIHPNQGLAYMNLGHLFDEMGAYQSAADAYAKAVAVEPSVLQFHTARLTYLTQRLPKDTALISAALTDASKQFGDTPSILAIEAQWLAAEGRYADAIKAWQTAKTLSPGTDTSSIDAEIARLQAKQ